MTEEQAKKFLSDTAELVDSGGTAYPADLAIRLHEVADLLQALRDELDSTWGMLDEMRLSEIDKHGDTISKEIERIVGDMRKIAKVENA